MVKKRNASGGKKRDKDRIGGNPRFQNTCFVVVVVFAYNVCMILQLAVFLAIPLLAKWIALYCMSHMTHSEDVNMMWSPLMLSRRLDVTNCICRWMTEDASLVLSLSRSYWKLHDISVTMTDFSWVNKHYELLTVTWTERWNAHPAVLSVDTLGKKFWGVQ